MGSKKESWKEIMEMKERKKGGKKEAKRIQKENSGTKKTLEMLDHVVLQVGDQLLQI